MDTDTKNSNTNGAFGVAVCVVILIVAGYFFFQHLPRQTHPANPPAPSGQSITDGTITVGYGDDFALATTAEQVLVHSYIPPCTEGFDYCLYYNGTAYAGTNFESAGLRIQKRADLAGASTCMQTMPDGYTNMTPKTFVGKDFSTSVFAPIGDGAAGHYATGTLYRLAYNGSCYEFETRIGATQFANYPTGTIREFTPAEEAVLAKKLADILGTITLSNGEKVVFPK